MEAILDTSSVTYNAVLDLLATSSSLVSGSDPLGQDPVVNLYKFTNISYDKDLLININ